MGNKNPRICIVDDDEDFASLLADVFSQASYEAVMMGDPTEAETRIREEEFSLVITDMRMPSMDGSELARRIRKVKPELPIIMVSGFLDSTHREKMEADGIIALYEKPLSVFSLLKNAAKIISESKKNGSRSKNGSGDPTSTASGTNGLGFKFSALPCESKAAKNFAESLYERRNRKQNICIITPAGSPFREVVADFFQWVENDKTGCHLIEPVELSKDSLANLVSAASEKGIENLILAVPETEDLDSKQQDQIGRGTRTGTFRDQWKGHIRFLFGIGQDVETIYQDGSLSDELYLAMGGSELTIPSLRDCPEDIKSIARNFTLEDGSKLTWEDNALNPLTGYDWPGNHRELTKFLSRLASDHAPEPISSDAVNTALQTEFAESKTEDNSAAPTDLRTSLLDCRESYLRGLNTLLDGDQEAVSSIADVSPKLVDQIVSQ